MLTSSAVVLEEHINTSSKLGSDGEVSCMYKDSTVPRMSSVMGFLNNKWLTNTAVGYTKVTVKEGDCEGIGSTHMETKCEK